MSFIFGLFKKNKTREELVGDIILTLNPELLECEAEFRAQFHNHYRLMVEMNQIARKIFEQRDTIMDCMKETYDTLSSSVGRFNLLIKSIKCLKVNVDTEYDKWIKIFYMHYGIVEHVICYEEKYKNYNILRRLYLKNNSEFIEFMREIMPQIEKLQRSVIDEFKNI